MARIFITGSSDGIGLVAARSLIAQGHQVTLHARNQQRANEAQKAAPGAEGVLVSDISTVAGMKNLASEANKTGAFDAVIHNAGVGYSQPFRKTEDGIATVFARLIYTSSGLHSGGDGSLNDVTWTSGRPWNGFQAYSDSKLHDVILAHAVARRWKDVESNAVDPGWVATKMGGMSAPGTVDAGADTLSYLAEGKESASGKLFKNRRPVRSHDAAGKVDVQEKFLQICEKLSGVSFPEH
ncbi:hypothetical protein H2203_002992 [Taxawa tesnikishii (nom. ined.)]|nr:hypothetical protein H2203_002992 [Dothideales sp. JES 119]